MGFENVRQIARAHQYTLTVVVDTTGGATSTEIDYRWFASGTIHMPASGSPSTALTFYGAPQPGEEYAQICDSTGTAVTIATPSAGFSYPIPDACFGVGALKIVCDSTLGNVYVSLKG